MPELSLPAQAVPREGHDGQYDSQANEATRQGVEPSHRAQPELPEPGEMVGRRQRSVLSRTIVLDGLVDSVVR